MLLEVNMSNENKQTKPKYTLEFKQDAAKLVIKHGYTQQQAADNLGVSLSAIRRWVKAEKGPEEKTIKNNSSLNLSGHDELLQLRKENKQLRMEREILKKAAVFFAKEAE